MVRIEVKKHAVDQYIKRVKTDFLREEKTPQNIRDIIINSIRSNNPLHSALEEHIFINIKVSIDIVDRKNKKYLGKYVLVLCEGKRKDKKGRCYSVRTLDYTRHFKKPNSHS
jgi:hypothetical protein